MPQHGFAEELAVSALFLGEVPDIGWMRFNAKMVKGASHVDITIGAHIKEREVNCAASGVARATCNIALFEEHAFVESGVEVGFHACIIWIF